MVVFLCIGIIYAWSIFAEVFKQNFQTWTNTALASTFTIIMAFFCVGNVSGGFILKKLSPKKTLLITGILIGLSFIAVSALQENTIWLLYLSYGVVGSFGVGLSYNVVLSVVTKWFPDKVGMASGILMMSFAFSTLVLGMGANYLMGIYSFRLVFILMGIVTAVVLFIGAALLKAPDENVVLPQAGKKASRASEAQASMTVNEMLKTSAFWLFFVWGIMQLICVYAVMGNAKQCVLELNPTAISIATLSVTIISVFNGLGRLILGTAYDKIGRLWTMTLDTALIIIASMLLIVSFKTGSIPLMIAGFMFVGFSYGGIPAIASAFSVDYFGPNDFSLKFGIINMFVFVGAFGSALAGIIKDNAGSYENLSYILIGLGILAMILNLGIRKRKVLK